MPDDILIKAVVAGLLASLACGLGVVPLMVPGLDPKRHSGTGYAVAAGLMFAASVYNLILPGLQVGEGEAAFHWTLAKMLPILGGLFIGAGFLSLSGKLIEDHDLGERLGKGVGGAGGLLIFLAMLIHSIPEGVAVGVGYTAEGTEYAHNPNMGSYLALAIGIHNIPEGLAVAIPLRAAGVSLHKCFWLAVLTSVPQPIAAVPAVLAAWLFNPLMPWLMAFAAGAMIFLVVEELIPEANKTLSCQRVAWAFTFGFGGMMLIQTVL
ncbi:ZIP family metal transporter [Algisphaera agarilytica]|uniref:ZIP family zinc transporter n=1 Tax=Algisphaera agarilytica TaxID=1385975 RepID=A0A7X0H615_9BACT|nr:ZIP family metal transporter [Algisphaera agarilytica]MBB6429712.1 ZIP family zinc transporter [Algisphaera agarilytica]